MFSVGCSAQLRGGDADSATTRTGWWVRRVPWWLWWHSGDAVPDVPAMMRSGKIWQKMARYGQWEGDARNQGAKVRGWEKNRTILQREKQLFKVGDFELVDAKQFFRFFSAKQFLPWFAGDVAQCPKDWWPKTSNILYTDYILILLQYALHHLHRIHTIQKVRFEGTPGRGAEGQELPFSTSGRRLGIDADTKRPLGTCITKRIMFYGFLWISMDIIGYLSISMVLKVFHPFSICIHWHHWSWK